MEPIGLVVPHYAAKAYAELMDREKEIEGMALWVQQHHGDNGPRFIAEQIGRCALEDEPGGIELWRSVAKRFDEAYRRTVDSGRCKADR